MKRALFIIAALVVLLPIIWLGTASIPPNPQNTFDEYFGAENRYAVSDIKALKPTFMDGHFISFAITQADFNRLIRPHFEETGTNFRLLHGQKLPEGWPPWVESSDEPLYRVVNYNTVLVLYDPATSHAYASVRYD